ncbi:helix-turn-helix domain-containing protein [Pseudoroseomonas wenyumeiae]|uniref:AraC family transcriptional regulator n=1 Tax=Teichococcus wenyumeiae TaxID=2478470 RepID=A0A3A9JPY0_9PROT|nr:AraC family transcriptional regulator [Pseudoroseomonas wenyumeiae]RKK05966.1 AraC family transcriptional regulator [Pseudoroseomonas wenyumeiae]RMI19811.1 helix-turn-helix domain-containing protein [Pseudoroseomonas wenyumeiae]
MSSLLDLVRRHGKAHADGYGIARSDIQGLSTVHATAPSELVHDISRPLACLVVQGGKRVTMGTRDFNFGAGDLLLITADVPTVSQVTRASTAEPYLSLVVELNPGIIADLSLQMDGTAATDADAVRVEPTEVEVAEAATRLMRLLDRPAALPVLQASLMRELHYWLLAGRHGAAVRRIGWPGGHVERVSRAVAVLRTRFAEPLPVESLAAVAGMSPSSFHQHFRSVTSLSPLQFQKQLRLIEARRLMQGEGRSASSAAFAVGYESVPQFTREYGRLFGLPPARDAEAARRSAETPT